jgi:hypothetical protein
MNFIHIFYNLFIIILQLIQQIYSFIISFIHLSNEFCSYFLQLTSLLEILSFVTSHYAIGM